MKTEPSLALREIAEKHAKAYYNNDEIKRSILSALTEVFELKEQGHCVCAPDPMPYDPKCPVHSPQPTLGAASEEWTPARLAEIFGEDEENALNWERASRWSVLADTVNASLAKLREELEAWKRRAEGMKLGNENYERENVFLRERIKELEESAKYGQAG
jgi:hypothetical protein